MSKRTLKSSWQFWRFDQMATIVNDRIDDPSMAGVERYVGLEHLDSDSLKIRRWGAPSDVEATKLIFRKGDIIFGRRRAYQRKLAVADFDGICSAHAMVLQARPDVASPDFLPFFMQSDLFMNRALEISVGSLSPTINWKTLAQQEFALPPLGEQHRLAGLFSQIDKYKQYLHEIVTASERLWHSAAAGYFSESGLAVTYNQQSDKRLGSFLAYASDGPFGSKLKTEHYAEQGVRVVRLQNIQRLLFDETDKAYISPEYYHADLVGYAVHPGDVLIAGLGDESIQAGRSCIAPESLHEAINKADCYCLRPNDELDAGYLVAFLNSPEGLRQSLSYSQGTTRYRLNLGNIKRMKVPVPALDIQQEIANVLVEIHLREIMAQARLTDHTSFSRHLVNSLLMGE